MNNGEPDIAVVAQYGAFLNELKSQFLKNYREEFAELIRYVQTLMGALAVIAGFGFTAYQFINNLTLFFIGETLVVFSILYLIYKTKIYISGQPTSTETWLNNSVSKMAEIKTALLEKNQDNLKRLAAEFTSDVNKVAKEMPAFEASKNVSENLNTAFWLGTAGIALIFTSFILCL